MLFSVFKAPLQEKSLKKPGRKKCLPGTLSIFGHISEETHLEQRTAETNILFRLDNSSFANIG